MRCAAHREHRIAGCGRDALFVVRSPMSLLLRESGCAIATCADACVFCLFAESLYVVRRVGRRERATANAVRARGCRIYRRRPTFRVICEHATTAVCRPELSHGKRKPPYCFLRTFKMNENGDIRVCIARIARAPSIARNCSARAGRYDPPVRRSSHSPLT